MRNQEPIECMRLMRPAAPCCSSCLNAEDGSLICLGNLFLPTDPGVCDGKLEGGTMSFRQGSPTSRSSRFSPTGDLAPLPPPQLTLCANAGLSFGSGFSPPPQMLLGTTLQNTFPPSPASLVGTNGTVCTGSPAQVTQAAPLTRARSKA